jgi:predicted metalloprotease with PDZ domain
MYSKPISFTKKTFLVLSLAASIRAQGTKPSIQITADLSDAPRRLYHAEIDLPVTAGPLTLTTPEWIPGTHQSAGPAAAITGVVFAAGGHPLVWRRDDVDLFEFHLTIPKEVSSIHVHLDCIVTSRVTQKMAVLEWEHLLLYPAHTPVRDIPIQPSVIVPAGWGIGTALTPVGSGPYPVPAAGSITHFSATNVEQLEDSPILSGQYFHEFPLAPEISPKHYLDVVSDEPEDSNLRPAVLQEVENLVREADRLYRSHHYNEYHFLLTLSNVAGGEGLEHGQSSNNGVSEKTFSDDAHQLGDADLLPHEFTHSWNGKYRRPVGLFQTDFATPQQGALLWVYEGMTQYLGDVLAARSGLESPAQYRDRLALSAANLDNKPGREWRSTEDTAIAASILRGGNSDWVSWRRSQDYYAEGELLWLDADTLIREMTNNRRSLDDFERIFLAKGNNTGPLIVPYTFDELVGDLNDVVGYNWAAFLHDRVDKINPHADLAGIERGGYRLSYQDKPNDTAQTMSATDGSGGVNAWYSVGLRLGDDGSIFDVRKDSPADNARLAPDQKILAVNGQIFSSSRFRAAIRGTKEKPEPINLILLSDTYVSNASINYNGGERYPVLERVEGSPSYLDDITKPLVPPHGAAQLSPPGDSNNGKN